MFLLFFARFDAVFAYFEIDFAYFETQTAKIALYFKKL